MIGTVFDIKEFSVYDGPGMRTTVFLKGCPLRCRWCHNPEGLSAEPEIWINAGSCTHCGKCGLTNCQKALTGHCNACGKCVNKCPGAFRRICGKRMTADELEKKLLRQKFFLDNGGVTFSGGEPTMQPAFLYEMLERLGNDGIHRAIQTCGYCEPDVFSDILSHVDYVLYDIKLADPVKHKEYTGVSNEKILRNLNTLIERGIPFVARTPLIAGVNDDTDNLDASAELVKKAKNLERYELLPYNGAAGGKYAMVGREYAYRDYHAPEHIDLSPFLSRGIEVRVL